jgi:hypothetical protein
LEEEEGFVLLLLLLLFRWEGEDDSNWGGGDIELLGSVAMMVVITRLCLRAAMSLKTPDGVVNKPSVSLDDDDDAAAVAVMGGISEGCARDVAYEYVGGDSVIQ